MKRFRELWDHLEKEKDNQGLCLLLGLQVASNSYRMRNILDEAFPEDVASCFWPRGKAGFEFLKFRILEKENMKGKLKLDALKHKIRITCRFDDHVYVIRYRYKFQYQEEDLYEHPDDYDNDTSDVAHGDVRALRFMFHEARKKIKEEDYNDVATAKLPKEGALTAPQFLAQLQDLLQDTTKWKTPLQRFREELHLLEQKRQSQETASKEEAKCEDTDSP